MLALVDPIAIGLGIFFAGMGVFVACFGLLMFRDG